MKRATVAIPSPDRTGPAKVLVVGSGIYFLWLAELVRHINITTRMQIQEVRVGVVHGTAETRALLERMRAGDPDAQ